MTSGPEEGAVCVDLDDILNLDDLEKAAARVLDAQDFDYYAGAAPPTTTPPVGAETESTLRANVAAFSGVVLWPRVMVDVSKVDMATSVPALGLLNLTAPLMASPVAMQKLAHPGGECAAARACAAHGVGYCASQQSTTTLEEIGRSGGGGPKMFQLYVLRDRETVRRLLARAEAMGATAIAVTVDAPALGRRERDIRHKFKLRRGLKLANVDGGGGNAQTRSQTPPPSSGASSSSQSTIAKRIGNRDSGFNWADLAWLKSATSLPIVLKGVVTRADAALAVTHGVAGVWVSNHGGRQLDGAASTLAALPEVVAGVAGRVPVIFDGGVRRGVDVLKALALGADLVCVGRPVAWGLACGGEAGVAHAFGLLKEELHVAMMLAGCPDVEAARRRGLVQLPGEAPPCGCPVASKL